MLEQGVGEVDKNHCLADGRSHPAHARSVCGLGLYTLPPAANAMASNLPSSPAMRRAHELQWSASGKGCRSGGGYYESAPPWLTPNNPNNRIWRSVILVALRSQPIDAAAACQPLVNFSLALKAPDVSNFGSGIVSFDLPLALCDTVKFEGNTRFAHCLIMPIFGIAR